MDNEKLEKNFSQKKIPEFWVRDLKKVSNLGSSIGLFKFWTVTIKILNPSAHTQIKDLGIWFKMSEDIFWSYLRVLSHP